MTDRDDLPTRLRGWTRTCGNPHRDETCPICADFLAAADRIEEQATEIELLRDELADAEDRADAYADAMETGRRANDAE